MSRNAHMTVLRDDASAQPAVFVAAWLLAGIAAQPAVAVCVIDRGQIRVQSTPAAHEALLATVAALLVEVRFAGWRIATPEDKMPEPYPGAHDDQLQGNA